MYKQKKKSNFCFFVRTLGRGESFIYYFYFLICAFVFEGIKIQSETHDSIEDARAALRLYKKYLELEAQGILQSSLEEMYTVGKSLHWKVPGVETH